EGPGAQRHHRRVDPDHRHQGEPEPAVRAPAVECGQGRDGPDHQDDAVELLLLGPAPLHADWIVPRQGERFEIRGTWQLKGKLLVFTLPNGTLSSMRAARVDIDASKQATAQAKQQAAAPPPAAKVEPKRKSVIVLTDK